MHELTHRKARRDDLEKIISLLLEDELGQTREVDNGADPRYAQAFEQIQKDPNQYLMLVEQAGEIVGTCHLTLIPSLTFTGTTRLNIEAVRVSQKCRGAGIGAWMIEQAIEYSKTHGAGIVQLTTNKKRARVLKFYESLGFSASHEGMKLYLNR